MPEPDLLHFILLVKQLEDFNVMKISENTINMLASLYFKGIGKAWVINNSVWNKSVEEIVSLVSNKTKQDEIEVSVQFEDFKIKVCSLISSYEGIADGIIGIGDPGFPECRGTIKNSDQPILLAYRGDISLISKQNKNIAVIGVLNPSESIEQRERAVVSKLVSSGYTIVSGLALGCDSISHTEALAQGGKTVAILPSTLKNIQPVANRQLAEDIVANGGLVVTEYLNEAYSKQNFISRFIERDRLQAFFSDCVLLSASYAPNAFGNDCGSRHALRNAKEAGIKRAVMYDESLDKNNPQFDLNRVVMREDGINAIILTENTFKDSIKKIEPKTKSVQLPLF